MSSHLRLVVAVSCLTVLGTAAPAGAQPAADLAEGIRIRLEAGRAAGAWTAAGRRVLAVGALSAFYEARGFAPAWSGSGGAGRLSELLAAIDGIERHGLDRDDYRRTALDSLRRATASPEASLASRVDLELLATDMFLVLGSHLLMGRVDPRSVNPEWLANRRDAAFHEVLEDALATDRIQASLEALAPSQVGYGRLLAAAERLRETAAAGGWPTIGPGEKLEVGSEGPRVARLRARLRVSGDLDASSPDGDGFDAALEAAVMRFQRRHGLTADGVVGPATVAALDVGPAERARQIAINLERWRWLPEDLGARHIEVNIAGFDVRVVEEGRTVRTHRVIVGRQYRETPVFSDTMTYLVFAPYWHVPPTIAAVDKLPLIKADPSVIAAQRMTLLSPATNAPVDPATVDWGTMTGAEFNRLYRLRQDPGPANALGAVKFMFPNRYNVYLHDTPSRELFMRTSRSFSSGCIRVERPLELAEYLLADQPDWTRERIDRVIASGVEQAVRLRRPLPVHLLYWTAWADEEGTIHFRDDIYARDRALWSGVTAPPPGP